MASETTLQRVLRDDVDAQLIRLDMFLQLLNRMFQVSSSYTVSARPTLLVASILKVQQSGRAVKLLAEEGLVEEILAVGRTLVEVTVNVCYLQCASPRELERYLSFHPERGYKHAGMVRYRGRTSTQGWRSKWKDMVSWMMPAVHAQEAGRNWTQFSLAQRAEIADERTNIPVMSLLLSRCYPRGDAAVHGTMGSLDNFVEALQTQQMPLREDRYQEMAEALFGVNLTLMSFSLFLDEHFRLGMHDAIHQISAADSSTNADLLER